MRQGARGASVYTLQNRLRAHGFNTDDLESPTKADGTQEERGWALAVQVFAATLSADLFFYYLSAWSGALVFTKFADKWDGSLPFGKGAPGAAPTTPPTP